MEIIEALPEEYKHSFPKNLHVFNSVSFNNVNRYKVEQLYYLVFKDTKVRLGLILGAKNEALNSPFSSPFGGFDTVRTDLPLSIIDESLRVLKAWFLSKGYNQIQIVLPPTFYHPVFYNKLFNCLVRADFSMFRTDLNYQFHLDDFENTYINQLPRNSKRNLKKSIESGLVFVKLNESAGKIAYDIISQNRKERGFPLRMSWEQLEESISVIQADFFIVKKDDHNIAGTIVFHVTDEVVQVIYWGDISEFSEFKTMNFLSYNIFKHYAQTGKTTVDIGPSTENSIPNYGLCEFKEKIGCAISSKLAFKLTNVK